MPKSKFFSSWKNFLKNHNLRIEFIVTVIALVIIVYLFSRYLIFNEARPGAILDDPVLQYFDAINLNTLIFFTIYSSLIFLMSLFFLIRWIQYRNHFPLKERSPKLLLFSGIYIAAHMLCYPLTLLILNWKQVDFDTQTLSLDLAIVATIRICEFLPYFLR